MRRNAAPWPSPPARVDARPAPAHPPGVSTRSALPPGSRRTLLQTYRYARDPYGFFIKMVEEYGDPYDPMGGEPCIDALIARLPPPAVFSLVMADAIASMIESR